MSAEINDYYEIMVAYDKARGEQEANFETLPTWSALHPPMREALVVVYFAGARRADEMALAVGTRIFRWVCLAGAAVLLAYATYRLWTGQP